jgi:hypothetical protein
MKRLFVEELESRNLLSAAKLGHAISQGFEPSRLESAPFFSANRSVFDFGSRDQFSDDFRTGPFSDEPASNGYAFSQASVSFVQTVEIIIILPEQAAETPSVPDGPAVNQLGARQATGAFVNGAPAAISIPLFQGAPINPQRSLGQFSDVAAVTAFEGAASGNVASAESIASNKSSALAVTRPETLSSTGSFRSLSSSLLAAAPAQRAGSEPGGAIDGPGESIQPLPSTPRLPALELPQSPLAQTIRAGLASVPQLVDLMNGFSNMSLDRIEQGIAGFLTALESGGSTALAASERDYYPWILAGVVTVAACEMARRQLRKPLLAESFDGADLPLAPWEIPLDGENERSAR